jgi:5-methyltetrahydrofolate--homocysteine methyltransferase
MKVTIEQLKAAGLRDKVRVMVGGAPVNDKLAAEIGADGYAEDAAGAVALARRLVGVPA